MVRGLGLEVTKCYDKGQDKELKPVLYFHYFTGHYLSPKTIIPTCFVSPFLICVVFMLLLDIVHLCKQYEYER